MGFTSKPPAAKLRIVREFKVDKDCWMVVHGERVLCQGIREYPYMRYHPILWKLYTDCDRWVQNGCIGDIQEEYQNLCIVFQKQHLRLLDRAKEY